MAGFDHSAPYHAALRAQRKPAAEQAYLNEFAALLHPDDSMVAMLPCRNDFGFVVGRGDDATITISDPYLSRLHARLTWDERTSFHVLTDLGSANGTRLNGRRVRVPVRLHDGAVLQFGMTALRYRRWTGSAHETTPNAQEVDTMAGTRRIRFA